MAVTDHERERARSVSELYRSHAKWLSLAVRRHGGGEASDDIVQETYVRVARMAPDQSVRHPKALLLTVARRLLRDVRRGAAREEARLQAAAELSGASWVVDDGQFEALLLKQTILALPERYRDVFVMHRFGGMSYDAIAQARGLTVKAVEWRVNKAAAICTAKLSE